MYVEYFGFLPSQELQSIFFMLFYTGLAINYVEYFGFLPEFIPMQMGTGITIYFFYAILYWFSYINKQYSGVSAKNHYSVLNF